MGPLGSVIRQEITLESFPNHQTQSEPSNDDRSTTKEVEWRPELLADHTHVLSIQCVHTSVPIASRDALLDEIERDRLHAER